MSLKEYIDRGVEALASLYSKDESKSLLAMAVEHFCAWPSHVYYTDPGRELPAGALPELQQALAELCRARPIQYILGETLFEGCVLKLREGVLIPRPETAELVRLARHVLAERLSAKPDAPLRILDVCTGSGAIAIALAKTFPQAEVYGLDISREALEVARENGALNGVRVSFLEGDMLQAPDVQALSLAPHSFDLMISNPPYLRLSEKAQMRPNVLDYEPHLALFVPDDDPLLFYRALADWGKALLKDKGMLMAEINEQMGKELKLLLAHLGHTSIQLRCDLNGKPRIISALRS